MLSDDDEDEDEDASTPGSEDDAAAAAEEEGMNPWEDPRAAEDSLHTPLSPGRRKTRARR